MGITIGGWFSVSIGIVVLLTGAGLMIYFLKAKETFRLALLSMLSGLVVAALFIGGTIIYAGTEGGKRAYKDQQSNFTGGIRRTVTVYDLNGNLIKEYSGEFDVETDNLPSYFLFDDENGSRHIIIPGTATVFIDEQ